MDGCKSGAASLFAAKAAPAGVKPGDGSGRELRPHRSKLVLVGRKRGKQLSFSFLSSMTKGKRKKKESVAAGEKGRKGVKYKRGITRRGRERRWRYWK